MSIRNRENPHQRAIFCDEKSVFEELGLRFAEEPRDADIIWVREGQKQILPGLRGDQLINHIPGHVAMVNKGCLTGHLKGFDQVQSTYDFSSSDFYRATYRLYDEQERGAFYTRLFEQDVRDNLWILKPAGEAMSRGVRILWQFDEARKLQRGADDGRLDQALVDSGGYIAQHYIKNPLLLRGHKSEIRLFWLVACIDPLLVFLYRQGLVRLSSEPFDLGDLDDLLAHVNTLEVMWGFPEFESYVSDELKLAAPGFLDRQLRPKFKECLAYVVSATSEHWDRTSANGAPFGLYGADFILDDTLRPWLTEVQKGPNLGYKDPIKRFVPEMLREAARIVLEVQERKRDGQALGRLDSVDGFEWVMNAA